MNLNDLAIKYGTDKSEHGYIPLYEEHLPKNPQRILEIGCLKGASLRMWREYFPNTELHSLDLFEEYKQPTDISGVTYWKGSQTDQYLLEQLRRTKFDVIIDDGSHNSVDQLVSFWSLMGSTKLYVCEDLHCAKYESYRQGLPFYKTMLGQMQAGVFPVQHSLYNDKISFIQTDKLNIKIKIHAH